MPWRSIYSLFSSSYPSFLAQIKKTKTEQDKTRNQHFFHIGFLDQLSSEAKSWIVVAITCAAPCIDHNWLWGTFYFVALINSTQFNSIQFWFLVYLFSFPLQLTALVTLDKIRKYWLFMIAFPCSLTLDHIQIFSLPNPKYTHRKWIFWYAKYEILK